MRVISVFGSEQDRSECVEVNRDGLGKWMGVVRVSRLDLSAVLADKHCQYFWKQKIVVRIWDRMLVCGTKQAWSASGSGVRDGWWKSVGVNRCGQNLWKWMCLVRLSCNGEVWSESVGEHEWGLWEWMGVVRVCCNGWVWLKSVGDDRHGQSLWEQWVWSEFLVMDRCGLGSGGIHGHGQRLLE